MEYYGHRQKSEYPLGSGKNLNGTNSFPTISRQNSILEVGDSYQRPKYVWQSPNQVLLQQDKNIFSKTQNTKDKLFPNKQAFSNESVFKDCNKNNNSVQSLDSGLYTKYTLGSWKHFNQLRFEDSIAQQAFSEKLWYESDQAYKIAEKKTKLAQAESHHKLGERISDTNFLKKEICSAIERMLTASSDLKSAKRIVEKALAETEKILDLVQKCLYRRSQRKGIELVYDNPEKQLNQEVKTINYCQDRLREIVTRASMQLSRNSEVLFQLHKDNLDKFKAQIIDLDTFHIHDNAAIVGEDILKIDNTMSAPMSWSAFTETNIKTSEVELVATQRLCHDINQLLNQCNSDMTSQWALTNEALLHRIREMAEARDRLQIHLSKVIQTIHDTTENVKSLQNAIQVKQRPLRIAKIQFEARMHRPNVEACYDRAQIGFVDEVKEITNIVESMKKQLLKTEEALEGMYQVKLELESNICNKTCSMFIDRDKCLSLRQTYPLNLIYGILISPMPDIS